MHVIDLEIVGKNDNGHPVDIEADKLVKLEEEIVSFLKQKQTVHFLGCVTRRGFRDLLYYIDTPKSEQTEVDAFCDNIMKDRGIESGVEIDPK